MATKLITPSVATQVTQALQPTQATVQTQPTQALTATLPTIEKLQVIQRNKQYNAKQVETFLANYNDPTELNSYIDALTNREAVSKEFGDAWGTISTASGSVAVLSYVASAVLELAAWVLSIATTDAGAIGVAGSAAAKAIRGLGTAAKVASTVGKVASLPAIPAAAKVTYNYGIKPIAHGKGNEAFLNTLMNLGETMDAAANPVKGLFIEGPQGFIKGTGLADGGRVQYDYDTGNVAADMFLEIISDPLNWIEMPVKAGIKGAAKTAAKNTVEASTETIIKNVNDIIKNVDGLKSIGLEGTARIQKKVQKTAQRLAIQWSEASTKELTKEQTEVLVKQGTLELQRTLTRAIESEIKNVSGTTLELALKKAGKEIEWNKLTQESLSTIYKDLEFDKLATHTIRELSKITAYTDAFQASMTKGALMTSGYGAGITLIKKLGDPLITWFKNKHIQGMVSAKYFDQVKGITDLTKFEEAKNYWVNLGKYGSNLLYNATESPIQDVDSFYRYFTGQLDRDQQLFRKALQDHVTEPNAQFAAFNALTQELYGLDFTQYLEYLKTINKNNNNLCAKHLQYLDSVHSNIFKQAATQSVAESIKTSAQLYAKHTITDLIKEPVEILKKLQAVKTAKNPDDIVKTLYTLKLNDFAVNAALVNDPKISEVLLKINSPDGIGAFLDNIISDAKTLEPEMLATLSDNVRVLKSAGQNFINIRDLYDNIAKMSLPKIEGVNADDFKRYVLDQIFGFTDDVNSLLANFDNTTMRDLMTRIEMFLGEGTNYFKFTETTYKVVYDQIASAFKDYLVAQQTAGLNTIKATIVQNFTQAIDDLLKQFPQFSNELQELASVSDLIKMTLATVRKENEYLLNLIFTDSETIFKAYSARQLSDMGLALRTVATKECLEMFDNIDLLSSNQLLQVEKMGKRMRHTMKQCEQYSHMFTQEIVSDITNLYDNVWRDFVEAVDDPDLDLFKLLIRDAEDTVDPIKRFAHLVELYKTVSGNEALLKEWQNVINPLALDEPDVAAVYRLIANPKMLYKTDFAWDAMAQAAFYAERDFNQKLINLVGLYDDLGVASKKIDADFKDLHDILSSDAVNNPKILQLERYSRATKSAIDTLTWFREKYNSLFDTKLAQDTIDDLRKILLEFPELNKDYASTVDTLEKYWRGEIQFKQDPKYVQGGIDEFTPFWEKVKEMNDAIQASVREYNTKLYQTFKANTIKFDKAHNLALYEQYIASKKAYTPITPWDPIRKMQEVNKAIHRASDANALSSLQRVFSFTPEQLQKELAFRHRFITFSDSDLSGNKTLSRAFNRLKSITNAELGIHYIYDPIKQRHWIVLDKQVRMQGREVYLDGVHLIREKFTKTFNEFQQVDTLLEASEDLNLTKMFNEMSDNLETLTGSALGDSQGEFFSKEMMQKVYAEMPEEVKAILKEEDILQNEFFEAYAFNESILGTTASKNKLGMSSPNMIINAQNAITQAQCYIKAKTEYVHTVFDSMFSISGENSIYAKFSDADLLQALQSNSNYKLVALTDHKKYGLRVEEILPINEAAIKKGRELGAVIVPLQTYKDMYKMVNRRLGSSGLLKIWNRIMYVFKFGYLVRPGAWIRNWIDTNLKTNIELGSEASAYRNQSRKILRELEEINDFIAARDTDGFLRRAAIEEYFMTHPNSNLTIELYDEITTLYKPSGILGNIMSAEGLEDGADLWNTFTHYTGKIIDMGNKTEEVNRLALLLAELDKGADTTSAMAKLAKTHFDYSFKTNTEQLIEMVFPFTTFTLRNLSYWAEALEKHPWLMRNYIHFMKPHWDFKDYTPEELATNYQVQNQIKYGQLKLAEFEDKIITFKMNPSIQDALQMFSDPINNIYEKLAAPISEPLKAATGQYSNPLNLVPGIGPTIQDIKQTFKTGSPLPSAIGIMNKPVKKGIVKFKNNNLVNVNAYRWNSYHRPVYTKNTVIDSYSTIGVQRYQTRFYPVIDVAHDVKNMYSTNVYNKIKNKVKTDVYQGIRYRIRLDTNRFR